MQLSSHGITVESYIKQGELFHVVNGKGTITENAGCSQFTLSLKGHT